MFVRNDVLVDARVLKEAGSLRDAGHDVTVIGISRPGAPREVEREPRDGFTILRVPLPRWRRWWRWLRAPWRLWSIVRRRGGAPGSRMDGLDWVAMWRFGNLGWARAAAREAGPADVYHGHDLTGLPAAVLARRMHRPDARLVYDSHELFIVSGATVGRPAWAVDWLARREQDWAAEVDALVTVSNGYADHLRPLLGIERVVVVHNCPPRPLVDVPHSDLIRDAASVPAGAPIVLYHGGLRAGRGIRELAEAMLEPGLGSAHLVFLGFGPGTVEVRELAAQPRFAGRIHLLDPVPPMDVVRWVASADVAAMAIQATNRSYYLSTPNKMFEAFAAGVPIAASDFPGFRSIVADDPDGPLGELCDPADPCSIGRAVRALIELSPEDRADLSARVRKAARERWNWETESARLVALYADLERGK
jgi:glycosyltransferase involved in cell wall biosynthesis